MRKVISFLVLCLTGIAAANAETPTDDRNGVWVAKMNGGNCSNTVALSVGDGKIKFHSVVTNGSAEAVIQQDGRFSMTTASMGVFGVTTIDGKFEGANLAGTFTIKNRHHPCSSPYTASKSVAPPGPGPYDGNWAGGMSNHMMDLRCSGALSAQIAHGRITGTTIVAQTNLSISGVVRSDGSVAGRFDPWGYPFTGQFDGSSFKGHASFLSGGGRLCGGYYDVVLKRQP